MFSETMVSLVWYRLNKSEDLPSHQPSKNNLLFRMVVRYRTYIIYYGAVQLYHTNLIPVSYSAVMRSRDDDACLVPFMLFECMSSSCYQCVIANIFVLFSSFQSPRFMVFPSSLRTRITPAVSSQQRSFITVALSNRTRILPFAPLSLLVRSHPY
jgi:hypothetical protein